MNIKKYNEFVNEEINLKKAIIGFGSGDTSYELIITDKSY